MGSKYLAEQKNKLSTKVQTLTNDIKQKKIDNHTVNDETRDNVKYLSTLEIYFDFIMELLTQLLILYKVWWIH